MQQNSIFSRTIAVSEEEIAPVQLPSLNYAYLDASTL